MNATINTTGIETERLHIRNMTMNDLDAVHQVMNEGFGDSPLQERSEWLEWTVRNNTALARLYQPPYGERAIILKSTGKLIGAVGFVSTLVPDTLSYYRERSAQRASGLVVFEMGLFWAISTAHRGNGYALEAVQAMIDSAFKELWLKRIVATTDYDNLNSQKVMHKLGMMVERNPYNEPFWCQMVGILENPAHPVQTYIPKEESTRV